jgi:hypothetical protein
MMTRLNVSIAEEEMEKLLEMRKWWGGPDSNRRSTGIAAPLAYHPRERVIKLIVV